MSDLKKQKALIAAVAAAFVANPEAKELHVTEDGNCFLPANKNAADLHSRRTNQPVVIISREDFEGEKMDALNEAMSQREADEKAAIEAKELEEKELAAQEAELQEQADAFAKAEAEKQAADEKKLADEKIAAAAAEKEVKKTTKPTKK